MHPGIDVLDRVGFLLDYEIAHCVMGVGVLERDNSTIRSHLANRW